MSTSTPGALGGLTEELAQILSTYGDVPAEIGVGQFPHGRRFVVTLAVAGGKPGSCIVTIDYAGGQMIAKMLSETGEVGTDAATTKALRSAFEQAAAALATRAGSDRIELVVTSVESGGMGVPEGETTPYSISVGDAAPPLLMAISWDPTASVAAPTPGAPAAAERGVVDPRISGVEERIEDRIDVILDIDLPVVVRFGRTELPIKQLTRLGMGSVIDLGRSPDDPVELLVSGRVVAHGEVVIVGGNYGIRILDVASPSERVRSMEA